MSNIFNINLISNICNINLVLNIFNINLVSNMFNINLMSNIFHYHSTLKVKSIIITLIFFLFFFLKLETFKKYFLEKKVLLMSTQSTIHLTYSTLIWFKYIQQFSENCQNINLF